MNRLSSRQIPTKVGGGENGSEILRASLADVVMARPAILPPQGLRDMRLETIQKFHKP